MVDPAYEALRGLLADMIGDDETLNDPHGDGSGQDSQCPTGDDYNVLFDHVLNACRAANIDLNVEIARIKNAWQEHRRKATK